MLITIVIPFHNEAENLQVLLPTLSRAIDACHPYDVEVLLVDDASTDIGGMLVARHTETDSRFRLLKHTTRRGQTGAFKTSFAEARGDYIIRMDADLQDDPADLPKFVEKIDEGYDLIMGIRNQRKHSIPLRVLTAVYDTIVGALFATELHSNSGSFIALKARFVKNIPFMPNDHRYLPLIAMRRGAVKRFCIPLIHRARMHGKTKYSLTKKIVFGLPEVIKFYIRYSAGYYDLQK